MSIDPQEQRPSDHLTAKDGAALFAAIDALSKKIDGELRDIRGTIVNIQEKLIAVLSTQSRIEAGLADSRVNRLELELKEAELELERAEAEKKKAEERLNLKQEVKDKTIDTQDRIGTLARSAIVDLEKEKEAVRKAKIEDLKWSAIKAVVTWGSVGIVGLVIGFIWFLIRLYMDRGGP